MDQRRSKLDNMQLEAIKQDLLAGRYVDPRELSAFGITLARESGEPQDDEDDEGYDDDDDEDDEMDDEIDDDDDDWDDEDDEPCEGT